MYSFDLSKDLDLGKELAFLKNDLDIKRDFDRRRDLNVEREADMKNDLDLKRDFDLNRDLRLKREMDLENDLDLKRDFDLQRDLVLEREMDMKNDLDIKRDFDLKRDFNLKRELDLKHNLDLKRNLDFRPDMASNNPTDPQAQESDIAAERQRATAAAMMKQYNLHETSVNLGLKSRFNLTQEMDMRGFLGGLRKGAQGNSMENDMIDRENQARSEILATKMGRLKDIALDIQMDAIDQNRHLDGMGSEFDSTQGLLGGSVNRIGKMVSSGKGNRKLICYMVLLAVIMFFVIYFITKWTGSSKAS